jgi:uncharacterized protein (TIGR02117 family)
VFSIIPYNRDFKPVKDGIDIYIRSNGIHTDLVLPARNDYKDWTKELPIENTLSGDSSISYMAFGWGDKGFFLDTPHWADLKCKTLFKAIFAFGGTAMHITNYKYVTENDDCKKISISKEQYKRLVEYVEASFLKNTSGNCFCINGHCYNRYDSFYEARGKYSLLYTCNTWANEGLKHCGIKACLWTPFDKGIFFHY